MSGIRSRVDGSQAHVEFVPGLARLHIPQAYGQATIQVRDHQRLAVRREGGPPVGVGPANRLSAQLFRVVGRERTLLLSGFDVPEPDRGGTTVQGEDGLAVR